MIEANANATHTNQAQSQPQPDPSVIQRQPCYDSTVRPVSAELEGRCLPYPLCAAPTGVCRQAHRNLHMKGLEE
jgi:hypothetical protein